MPNPKPLRQALALAALLALAPSMPTFAQMKPPQAAVATREEAREQLFAALKSAPDEETARDIEDQIWRLWIDGPSREATLLLEDAMARRFSFDYAGALAALDILVEMAPAWSEAWNQRAFVRFLREEYDGSLEDIERTLALEPKHFGALAGKAQILFLQGDDAGGQDVLRRAVEIHPWLKERFLLRVQPGRDI